MVIANKSKLQFRHSETFKLNIALKQYLKIKNSERTPYLCC